MKVPTAVTASRAKYEAADAALQAFIETYRDMYEEYEQLVIHRNEALGEYKASVSDHAEQLGRSFGSWKIQVPRKLNAEKLIEHLGEDGAEPLLKVKVTVNSSVYDQAVSDGLIDEEVQKEVEEDDSPRLRGPQTVGLYIR